MEDAKLITDYEVLKSKDIRFNDILFRQFDRVGIASIVQEKIIKEDDGTRIRIKPPILESIRQFAIISYPYTEIEFDLKNKDVNYWLEIELKIIKLLKQKGMLLIQEGEEVWE